MPSDYYRFLLSGSRNRFLSTDLQSAFWKRLGKEPSLGFPMDLTNLHALLNDQKGGLSKRIDFASTRIQAAKYTSLLPYGRIGDAQVRWGTTAFFSTSLIQSRLLNFTLPESPFPV